MSEIIEIMAGRAREAARRIASFIIRTPLRRSAAFSADLDADVYFKLDNLQTTGSFKLRGATNRLLTLSDEKRNAGCVTASTGNHGAAFACATKKLGASGIIFVPEQTSSVKVDAIKGYGGDVRFFGTDGVDTEQHARAYADENDLFYMSPYNDEQVIAGQGSCGVEIVEQLPKVDAVFVAVGGGGLIAGVGSVLKAYNPDIRVFACQPRKSAVMAHSIKAGEILDMESDPTLSDATAGGIEANAITFPMIQAVVDEFILVDEEQIAAAMRLFMEREGHAIEGAAGVAVAGMLSRMGELHDKKVVAIICGGNISADTLERVRNMGGNSG